MTEQIENFRARFQVLTDVQMAQLAEQGRLGVLAAEALAFELKQSLSQIAFRPRGESE